MTTFYKKFSYQIYSEKTIPNKLCLPQWNTPPGQAGTREGGGEQKK